MGFEMFQFFLVCFCNQAAYVKKLFSERSIQFCPEGILRVKILELSLNSCFTPLCAVFHFSLLMLGENKRENLL